MRRALLTTALCVSLPGQAFVAARAEPPRLQRQGTATQLVVGGKPMLLVAGELSNSAASSANYMAPHWARLKAMHLNTVLAPVSWELIEPEEGRFDWSSLDSMLRAARANNLKLVLLWFGAWKNSMSTYAPAWVKRDQGRFPRAELPNGQGAEILSTFGEQTLKADARAFAALNAHLAEVDRRDATVLMIQVENEIGMLPVARDYSAAANAAFAGAVPADLTAYLAAHRETLVPALKQVWEQNGARTAGTWSELFGQGDASAEIFAAWHYARFADSLTAAGKAAYPIPMYVNVALARPGRAPGQYPSGGPLPHLIDIWKAGAPHIDLLAPDIYFPNFVDIVNGYKRPDNPLFIPEANNADRPEVPANAFYAIGALDAIGFGPFSIDSVDGDPGALGEAYDVLGQLSPYILAAQGQGRMGGFKPRQLYDESLVYEPQTKVIGDYRFTVTFADIERPARTDDTAGAAAIIVQTGPEDYLIAGRDVHVYAEPVAGGQAGIDSAWEGRFGGDGAWSPGRLLNGDQTHQGRRIMLGHHFAIQKVRYYRYR
ncbi:MAG: hypothetical protein DI605_12620 [Sphingomonas sp.]|nr:MAG: hypothetical protein DI605_12620 [Sphingomonas sp.]